MITQFNDTYTLAETMMTQVSDKGIHKLKQWRPSPLTHIYISWNSDGVVQWHTYVLPGFDVLVARPKDFLSNYYNQN